MRKIERQLRQLLCFDLTEALQEQVRQHLKSQHIIDVISDIDDNLFFRINDRIDWMNTNS